MITVRNGYSLNEYAPTEYTYQYQQTVTPVSRSYSTPVLEGTGDTNTRPLVMSTTNRLITIGDKNSNPVFMGPSTNFYARQTSELCEAYTEKFGNYYEIVYHEGDRYSGIGGNFETQPNIALVSSGTRFFTDSDGNLVFLAYDVHYAVQWTENGQTRIEEYWAQHFERRDAYLLTQSRSQTDYLYTVTQSIV